MNYDEFLRSKVKLAQPDGITFSGKLNPALKPHQAIMVDWMISGGRRALFANYGLGKSVCQLEAMRVITEVKGGRALIVCPLGVRQEFIRDAKAVLGWSSLPKFIRSIEEADETGIYLTNYETVRDGKLDPRLFAAASLDEAASLRGGGSSLTFREFMRLFAGDEGPKADGQARLGVNGCVPYRFVATATPSPNDYIELLIYADFLGIMDISQAKTRYFKRDSTKADQLTIHPHKEQEFWLWVSSWALFVQSPADLDCPADGYELPPMEVCWHEVETDHRKAGVEKSGQHKMFRDSAIGVQDASAEKRSSMTVRVDKVGELLENSDGEQVVIWCDLNDEQKALEKELASMNITYSSLTGSDSVEDREELLNEWRSRHTKAFLSKPTMYGAGINLQQSHTMIFAGIGFKAYEVLQAIHRIHRFGQKEACTIHLIFTEAEREVRKQLERKWQQHNKMVNKMTEIIKKFGLNQQAMAQVLTRKMGVERIEVSGKRFKLVNWDSVLEMKQMEENSVGLILTSIPFSTQYEYSPNYADFGHSEGNKEFFAQMDFLTPEMLRVLAPGRIAAIHVKDRVVPGGMTGLGYQTVYPFHARCIEHYAKHGFGYMGMKTIVTDVVRENSQTYRLGWSEQCKDGTKMGVGMPEYLLIFRKTPSGTDNSYADKPVVKSKPPSVNKEGMRVPFERNLPIVPGSTGYSRARWQLDAHGFTRSSGDRLLDPKELMSLPHDVIYKLFRKHSLEKIYDFETHVKIGETMEASGKLPTDFMLLPPQSWSSEVWTDVTRMLTLNGAQNAKGKEMHLCPMQFDLADRVIEQMSMPGEIVFDPFAGLGTVPLRAVLKNRIGWGCELSPGYWADSVAYCRAAEEQIETPSLFDLDAIELAQKVS